MLISYYSVMKMIGAPKGCFHWGKVFFLMYLCFLKVRGFLYACSTLFLSSISKILNDAYI